MNKKRYNFKKRWKRIWYLIDAKLFERTYREEWEEQNRQLDIQKLRITQLEKQKRQLLKKIVLLEKKVNKNVKKVDS